MSKIVDSTEDGYRVFKKKQESAEEVIFYNTDYFKRIGFPDAEVSIGKVAEDGVMKGGYYKHPENLTYPFRQFVYLIQREKKRKSEETSEDADTNEDKNNEHPDFFHRVSGYGAEIGKGVQYGVDSVTPYFRTASENAKEAERIRLEKRKEEISREKEGEVDKKGDFDETNYWIVRIPIVKGDDIVPMGKYEKEEAKLQQTLREDKVDKSLGKSKRGEIYEVGSRYVRMCEEVVEYAPYEKLKSDLLYSEMSRRVV
jgi:hypothetical protein